MIRRPPAKKRKIDSDFAATTNKPKHQNEIDTKQYLHVSPPRWTLCWTLAEKKVIWRIYGAQTTEQGFCCGNGLDCNKCGCVSVEEGCCIGVKGIDRVSPIKSKGTGNSDSPRSRHVTMSERDMLVSSNPQSVSQFNPITGELFSSSANVDFSGIAPVVSNKLTEFEKDKALKHKAPVKNPTDVVYKPQKQKAPVKKPTAVVDKPDAVVVQETDKEPVEKPDVVGNVSILEGSLSSDIVPDEDEPVDMSLKKVLKKYKVKGNVKASVKDNVDVKGSLVSVKDIVDAKGSLPPVKDKIEVKGVNVSENEKLVDKVKDSVSVNEKPMDKVKAPVKPVKDKVDVGEDDVGKAPVKAVKEPVKAKSDVPNDKVKAPVKPVKDKVDVSVNKGSSSAKAPVKDKVNPKSKSAVSKDKPKQKEKSIVQELSVRVSRSKETPVKRKRILSKEDDRKKRLKGKSKKEDSSSDDDDVDSSSDDVDSSRIGRNVLLSSNVLLCSQPLLDFAQQFDWDFAVVMGLIATNVVVFLLRRVADSRFMVQNFMNRIVLEEELKNTKERGTKVLKEEIWNIEKRSEIHNGSRVEEQRAMDGLASALREVAT
ncbi:ELM2 domain-containing protein [Tanacetum coccineum]